MANVYTKDNGFGKTVIFSQKASDAFGYCHSAFVNNKVLIIILDVVLTIVSFQKDGEMLTGGDLFVKKGGKIRKTP